MTYAEALDLLELDDAGAADVQRIRDAYARRRKQLQSQMKAAAAEPLRAAYQETLAAVDMAAAMLQTRAATPGPGGNDSDSKPHRGLPKVYPPGAVAGREPDWIAATPWQNIREDQEEAAPRARPRSSEPPTAPAERRRQPPPQPVPRPAQPAIRKPEGTISLRLPQVGLESPPPEMRPITTRLGTPASAVPFPAPPDELPDHSRWGAYAALLLLIGGLAGAGGWAWKAGALDWLMANGKTEVATGNGGTTTAPAEPEVLPNGDPGASAAIDEQLRQLGLLRAEIERLATELSSQTEELGGGVMIDWKEQLAAGDREEAAGELEAAGGRLARLHDSLKAQTEAAERVLTSRQRLRNAGPLNGDSPLAKAALAHLQALERQAEVSIAESNYTVAAQKYDKALEARTRLPADIASIEPARAGAAAEHEKAVEALEKLDAGEEAVRRIAGDDSGIELLSGAGPLVAAWLAGERPATDLVTECEQLQTSLGGAADRLQQIAELEALTAASLKELDAIEDELGESVPAESLARLLPPTTDLDQSRRSAKAALAAGRLDDAIQSQDSAATDASAALEKAVAVRDLLMRRAQVAALLEKAGAGVAERFGKMDALIAQKAERAAETSPWPQAAARLADDRGVLLDLAAPLSALPEDPVSLELHVRQAELRAQAFEALAGAVEALAQAEYRLLLLMELSAGANVYVAGDTQVPLPAAAEARASAAKLSRNQAIAPDEAESARLALTSVTEQTNVAADRLVPPAAATLADMLRTSQESYREKFGRISIKEVWQPAQPLADVTPAAELALPVSEALSASAEEDALHRELSAGDVARAESILRHVRNLAAAQASLSALREAAETEDDQGMRQLHRSALAGETAEVRSLLALRVEAAPRDASGRTPLGIGLAAGHLEVVELLLESGGKPPAWLEGGRPIVFLAAASPEALRLLLEHGAPARDLHRGETALHALAWQANREQVQTAKQLESARILIDAGVDAAARNRSNQTAGELATSLGLRELAEMLSKAGPRR